MQPIFIFSLPRAGSTLLQRIVAGHPDVMTTSESWTLLPSIYALKEHGVFTEYGHLGVYMGVNDFVGSLPRRRSDYFESLHDFIISLFRKQARNGERFFLEKTPRYHLIIPEIMETFPEGKFIFLWRNPLAIAASIIDTWGRGKWNLYRFYIDLYEGLFRLTEAYRPNLGNMYALRYEDLITNSEKEIESLAAFLGIEGNIKVSDALPANELKGRMGDPTGVHEYGSVSQAPMEKWKSVLSNPFRKAWSKRYLDSIGEDRLRLMGYQSVELMKELEQTASSYQGMTSDFFRQVYGYLFRRFEFKILRFKRKQKKTMGHYYFHY